MNWSSNRESPDFCKCVSKFMGFCFLKHTSRYQNMQQIITINKNLYDKTIFCHFFELNHIPNAYNTLHGLVKISAKDRQIWLWRTGVVAW